MTLSANLGKAAPPHEITVTLDGEECTLEGQRLGLADWAKLSQIVFRKQVSTLTETRDIIGEKEFDRQLNRLSKRYNEGKLSFEAPEFRDWLQSTEGTCHTAMLIFGIEFADVINVLTCPEAKQVMNLFKVIYNESLPGVSRLKKKTAKQVASDPGVPDPNDLAPGS